ncbi:MAG: hypothetical protein AB1449_00695 [Chloroflexota bacterium]
MSSTRVSLQTALVGIGLSLLLGSCFTPSPIPTLISETIAPPLVLGTLPVSGSEPAYEPDLWNDAEGQCFWTDASLVECSTNCYAYALDDRTPLPYGTTLQPGQISGYSLTAADVTVERIIELSMADAAAGEYLFEEVAGNEACASGSYKIALVVDPIAPDYHWYRQNPDGTWSSKSGLTPVTDVDAGTH